MNQSQTKSKRKKDIKKIERHLRNYNTYKTGLKSLQQQLEYIMPSMTASYEFNGSTGTFNITSTTEKYAIDRIESRRALNLYEDIERYKIIIQSIDNALEDMDEIERKFVELRYFLKKTVTEVAIELGYSEKHVFNLRNQVMDKLLISLRGLTRM